MVSFAADEEKNGLCLGTRRLGSSQSEAEPVEPFLMHVAVNTDHASSFSSLYVSGELIFNVVEKIT